MTESPQDYGLPADHGEWRPHQKEALDIVLAMENPSTVILEAPTGCHRLGQGILMYNGSVKAVEDITVGELLMGPDSQPRTVLRIIQGHGLIYRIYPIKGESFDVSSDHVLTLQRTKQSPPLVKGQKRRKDCLNERILDVAISEWIDWSKTQKHLHKLFRTAVNFPNESPVRVHRIEPYFLGVLLGDGILSKNSVGVCSVDEPIVKEIYRQASLFGTRIRVESSNKRAPSYYLTIGRKGARRLNSLHIELSDLNLLGSSAGSKFIPAAYKTAPLRDRLELLAGLIDTDGYLNKGSGYDYVSKSPTLAEDVAFVARSIGLAAYIKSAEKWCQTGGGGTYYRVTISGHVNQIPCRLSRKQAPPRQQKKDVLRTGFSVKPIGQDYHCGFELDKDGRYLLDDFTVTHNSGKTALVAATATKDKVLAMMLTKDLEDQYSRLYGFDAMYGRGNYPCTEPQRVARWLKTYGYMPTGDDCSAMKECPTICPYKQAKAMAISSSKVAFNYSYSWYSEWWHKRGGYLFADEAHNLAISTISSLAQLEISEKQRQRWGLPSFPACSGTAEWAIQEVSDWVHSAADSLRHTLGNTKDERLQAKGTLLLRKFQTLTDLIWQGTWYVKGTNIGEPRLSCRPINPSAFADRLLGSHEKRVLMSATIGDAEMLAHELGITDYEFHSFPHNIPAEQRPVYLTNAPAMSYKSTWKDYEAQADVIRDICVRHQHDRILIHTTRWRHANDLADRLARKGLQDRVWVPDKTQGRLEQVAKLINPNDVGLIAIGPSFWEGLSLNNDLCRCVIVAKIPWGDRSDPVVAARLRQEGGGKWDRWCAALKVVQGCGRAVRDAEDFAMAYIADGSWNRVAGYAPKWFEVQS